MRILLSILVLCCGSASLALQNAPPAGVKQSSTSDEPKKAPKEIRVNVLFDCVFRYTSNTNCTDLKNTFYASTEALVLRVEDKDKADLILEVTDELFGNLEVQYNFRVTSKLPQTMGLSIPLPPLRLKAGLDSYSLLSSPHGLVNYAAKGVYEFFKVEKQTANPDGTATIIVSSPKESDVPHVDTWAEALAKSPWLFALAPGGSSYSNGSGAFNSKSQALDVPVTVAYMTDKFKAEVDGAFSYQYQSYPAGNGETISASNKAASLSELLIYSISKHWSVALINTTSKNPGGNYSQRNDLMTGLEWTLVPFRITENRELAFRIGPEYSTIKLLQPNAMGHLDEKYVTAFLQIYFYWVSAGDKVIISTSATVRDNFTYKDHYSANVGGKFTYNITPEIGFVGSVNYNYLKASLIYPGSPDYSNPLQTMFLSNQPGSSFGYSLNISFKFGNTTRSRQDRRWSN